MSLQGGNGSSGSPWEISKPSQLTYIEGCMDENFIITADITIDSSFEMIGKKNDQRFEGIIDFNNKEFTNSSNDGIYIFYWMREAHQAINVKNLVNGIINENIRLAKYFADGPPVPSTWVSDYGATPEEAGFASGSGSFSDPWVLTEQSHFRSMVNCLDENFSVSGEISIDGGARPQIGNSEKPFSGRFVGPGVLNFNVDNSAFGIFGHIDGAEINDLTIKMGEGIEISLGGGALAMVAANSEITNVLCRGVLLMAVTMLED